MAGLAAGAAAAGRLGAAGAAAGRLGAAGSAIGRLGEITGAASQYPKAFAGIEKMTDLLKNLAPIANAAAGMVGQLGDAVKQSIPGFTTLEKGITVTGEAVKAVAMFVPNVTKALTEFGQQLSQFVKYANPASVQKFGNALDDLHAVIGQALAPVLDLVTKSIRNAADSFGFVGKMGAAAARALDPFQRALETVYEWFGRAGNQLAKFGSSVGTSAAIVGEAVAAFAKALEPLGDLLIDVVGGLGNAIIGTHGPLEVATTYVVALGRALGDLTKWLADTARQILALVGLDVPNDPGTKPGSSTGAAVRNTSVGSIDDVMRRALTSAYSLGTGANPAVEAANATRALNTKAGEIYTQIREMAGDVKNLPGNIASAIEGLRDKAANAAADAIAAPLVQAQDYLQHQRDNVENWLGQNFSFGR